MNFVIVSDNYPSKQLPNRGAFVYNIAQQLRNSHSITVIAPFKFHDLLKPKVESYGEEKCKVIRPLYFSFSNKKILGVNTGKWSRYFKTKAVNRALKKMGEKPDVIYAHFLSNGQSALPYVKAHSIPLVIASGESSYAHFFNKQKKEIQKLKDYSSHFICVSETNRKELLKLGFDANKMTIIRNAVDYNLFKPLNKDVCKEKLGISKDKFVVGFIGHFIHRKGPNRVIEAIKKLNQRGIQLVCVGGKGNLILNSFTKVMAPIANYQLPEIYSAFDIFVLPTLSEGHCNVIEEAKACCVPVVSSLGTSVETQIDTSTGLLIDPLNIDQIAKAIQKLKEDKELRQSMATNLYLKKGELSLKKRAEKISSLLEKIKKESEHEKV